VPVTTIRVFYGVACAGKSTLAMRHAAEHRVRTVVATDCLREVQRAYVPAGQCPALWKVTHDAWRLLGGPTPANIVAGFISHAEAVWPAVDAVAGRLAADGMDAVIEGAHFHGPLISRLRRRHPQAAIDPALVTVSTRDELLEHITARERERAAAATARGWRASAAILMTIQDYLIADAARHGIPVIRAADSGSPA
jgi:2-phosphoglycerate kinase